MEELRPNLSDAGLSIFVPRPALMQYKRHASGTGDSSLTKDLQPLGFLEIFLLAEFCASIK
ncbi:MAG: hypothetical protein A3F54_05835 [Candidatus Kerfeldbacteria bacterium RIFCSPHIGHO2_12_FULL_48_17]|uniref:Uncharacterized protein n=1 Tax=Candidatus Kerfeldbacteria bacterium RIFCSPHIGHO2_12_FULL_48_17 TaxID=1798542 RepID=A0A1G2AZZ0_9BACT|nr:MAG: hypothetical protein A3F54_05835 [Candidatus Kerfeldbacteria bacterium RIFCSPHIGHO2_12_FULL_48_17]